MLTRWWSAAGWGVHRRRAGTMKVTEQIDARAMAINPVRYLVVPRLIASLIMLPVVTVFADAIAVFGATSWR
jgi:phospholipid/cholesterol/gamma-HCH transport system permease protein